jgi:hypothetical protein
VNDQQLACAGIIGYFETRFLLNHRLCSLFGYSLYRLGLLFNDRFNHPVDLCRNGPAFNDHNSVANLATQLIVGLHSMLSVDHFFIQRVPEGATGLDHNGLLHLVAGDNTSHPSSFIHLVPPS